MKLNYKRTVLVGLAFFSICAFWQMYDNVIPKILEKTFGLGETLTGFIMAIDNILAIFLLPLFGALSDKKGKRIPFIIGGTAGAVALTVVLSFLDDPALMLPFLVALGALLLSMSVYRSPAVALMPDVTPKPLRSKGNAVINLMGSLGGIYTLVMSMIFIKKVGDGERENYTAIFICVAALMAVAVFVLFCTVNEKKLKKEMEDINYGVPKNEDYVPDISEVDEDNVDEFIKGQKKQKAELSPAVRRSLILILASVFLWFMGYNAVTTAFTRYAENVWGLGTGSASLCLTIAQGGAIITYIPIGIISSKIGRRRMILIGVACLAAGFGAVGLFGQTFSPFLYVLFALIGFAWAAINVNSFPMVVEISRSGDIGKYTGYYYTFSMAAQIVTPILSGALIEIVEAQAGTVAGYSALFPYTVFFVALSFVTMLFVKHGDISAEHKAREVKN